MHTYHNYIFNKLEYNRNLPWVVVSNKGNVWRIVEFPREDKIQTEIFKKSIIIFTVLILQLECSRNALSFPQRKLKSNPNSKIQFRFVATFFVLNLLSSKEGSL